MLSVEEKKKKTALINMFETRLKEEHQHEEQVQYSVRDLYSFMDSVSELTVLV